MQLPTIRTPRKTLVTLGTMLATAASGLAPAGCSSAISNESTESAGAEISTTTCTPGGICCGQNGDWAPPDQLLGLAGSAAMSCLGEDPDAYPGVTPWAAPTNLGVCCSGAGSDGTCNGPGATNVGYASFAIAKDDLTSVTSWWHKDPVSCEVPANPVSCQLISDNCAGTTEKSAVCDLEFKSTSTLSGTITGQYSASGTVGFEAKAIGCGGSASATVSASVTAAGTVSGTWELDSTSHPTITVPSRGCVNGPALLYPSIAKTYWFLPQPGHVTMTIGGWSTTFACNSQSLGGKATMITKLYDHGGIAPLGQCAENDGQSGYDSSQYCGELPPAPNSGSGGSGGSGGSSSGGSMP